MTNKSVLEYKNVKKSYFNKKTQDIVLEEINFCINAGEIVSIIGPNGSGKSTLVKLALDILQPDEGQIIRNSLIFDEIGYIPQDYRNALLPWVNLYKNIATNINHNSKLLKPRISFKTLFSFYKMSTVFNIRFNLRKYPYQLSGGEQQIFLFLQLLIREPKFIVADELFSAIDVKRKEAIILYFLKWLKFRDIPMLFVTHDIRDALIMSDRIIILNRNSSKIKDIVKVDKPYPRDIDWMFTEEFNVILKYMTECLE